MTSRRSFMTLPTQFPQLQISICTSHCVRRLARARQIYPRAQRDTPASRDKDLTKLYGEAKDPPPPPQRANTSFEGSYKCVGRERTSDLSAKCISYTKFLARNLVKLSLSPDAKRTFFFEYINKNIKLKQFFFF